MYFICRCNSNSKRGGINRCGGNYAAEIKLVFLGMPNNDINDLLQYYSLPLIMMRGARSISFTTDL